MAAELVTAERRAGYDLEELARQVRQLAEVRGVEGGQLIPDGEGGARLPADRRFAVLALAALAEELSAEMLGWRRPVEPVATVGELRGLLLPLPAAAPILAPRADGCLDEAAAAVTVARAVADDPDGGWMVRRTGSGRLVLLVVPRE